MLLLKEDFVAFKTQEVYGCIDLRNTQISLFVVVSEEKDTCMLLSAREAAAAWTDTDTASRLGLCEKAPVRGRGKACAMHYYT